MEAIAKAKYIKGSPQKARLVIDLVRGKNVAKALAILKFTNKRAAGPISKCIHSAIANATYKAEQENIAIDPDDLWIKTCFVDIGPTKNRRRLRPAPQGRAYFERRHFCHITVELTSEMPEVKDGKKSRKKAKAAGKIGSGNNDSAKMSGGDSNKTHRDTKADKVKITDDVKDTESETEKTDDEVIKTKQETLKTKDNASKKDKKVTVETEEIAKEKEVPEVKETKSEKKAKETSKAKKEEKSEGKAKSADKKAGNKKAEEKVEAKEDKPEKLHEQSEDKARPETEAEPIGTATPKNKPLAAQSDEEKTGTDEAADRQIDENEWLERQ